MRDDALDCICPDGTREKMDAGSMERMKFIGITGGVGAGKSEILHYLETKDGVKVMLADEIAHDAARDRMLSEIKRHVFG